MARKMRKSGLLDLVRGLQEITLRDIRLGYALCVAQDLRDDELPANARHDAWLNVRKLDEKIACVEAEFKVLISYDPDDDPQIAVGASYVMTLELRNPVGGRIGNDTLQRASAMIALPYWREFVQSITTRMGLPAYMPPEINPLDLKKPSTKRASNGAKTKKSSRPATERE